MSGVNQIFSKTPHSLASQTFENTDTHIPIQEKKMVLPQGESVIIQNNNSSKTQLISTFVAANQSTQIHTAKETSRQSIQPHHEPQLQVKISSENIKIEKNNWNDPRQKEQHEKVVIKQNITARIPAGQTVQNKYETPIIDKPLRPIMVEKIDSDYNDDDDEDEESGDKRKRKSKRKLYIVLSLLSFLGAKSKRSMFVKESIRKKVSKNSSTSILKSFFDF